MVDIQPYNGDYTGTIVTNNTIAGGFAAGTAQAGQSKGVDPNGAVIK